MELWQAVVLGLVEGITEYLPISSTGHLVLVSSLMGLKTPEHEFAVNAFNIVVQGGAILAVLGLYWKRVVQMLKGLVGKDPAGLKLAINLVIAFIPAAVIGKLADHWIETHLFSTGPVIAALFVGGVYMILLDRWCCGPRNGVTVEGGPPEAPKLGVESLTPKKAFVIGMMQCVAMWPGTSRSMMTITGGMLVGLTPAAAAEFSFLLGLPTLGAATLYKLYKNVSESHAAQVPNLFGQLGLMPVLVGIVVAAVSAAVAVKWLVGFLNRRGLTPFGYYRMVLAVVLLALILAGVVRLKPSEKAPRHEGTQARSGEGKRAV